MTLKENIGAILECNFSGTKEEIIEAAAERIMEQIKSQGEYSNRQQVLVDVILPSLYDNDDATLFNKVSIILYDTYGQPMGAPLCAVITYVIKELKRREAENNE